VARLGRGDRLAVRGARAVLLQVGRGGRQRGALGRQVARALLQLVDAARPAAASRRLPAGLG
jgi:hypothetical protein